MKLTEDDIEIMLEVPVYEQIVNILKISSEGLEEQKEPTPAKMQIGQKAGRLSKNSNKLLIEEAQPPQQNKTFDLLFILTADFNCLLYQYKPVEGLLLLS